MENYDELFATFDQLGRDYDQLTAQLAALTAERDALREALKRTEGWVNLQGDYPGCRPAADSMLQVIRTALAGVTE